MVVCLISEKRKPKKFGFIKIKHFMREKMYNCFLKIS